MRVMEVIDHQVRNLRKIQVIGSLDKEERLGGYWGIRTDIAEYELADALPAPHAKTLKIAGIATRLKRMDEREQERLINWGYAVSDAGIRHRWKVPVAAPRAFPYPAAGVG